MVPCNATGRYVRLQLPGPARAGLGAAHQLAGRSLQRLLASCASEKASLTKLRQMAVEQFESMQALVRSIRNARAEYRVEPAKKVAATILASGPLMESLQAEADALAFLARVDPAWRPFASALNGIWPDLVRRTAPEAAERLPRQARSTGSTA